MSDTDTEYNLLFTLEFPTVMRTVYPILDDVDRAEDVTQDAFVQLLKHWKKVSRYDRPGAWVRRSRSASRWACCTASVSDRSWNGRSPLRRTAPRRPRRAARDRRAARHAAGVGRPLLLRGSDRWPRSPTSWAARRRPLACTSIERGTTSPACWRGGQRGCLLTIVSRSRCDDHRC